MNVKVLHLIDGQDWVAQVLSQDGKEFTVKCPMRILLQRTGPGEKDVGAILVPGLFFAEDGNVDVTVTAIYHYDPESELLANYTRIVSGLHIPPKSGLILG